MIHRTLKLYFLVALFAAGYLLAAGGERPANAIAVAAPVPEGKPAAAEVPVTQAAERVFELRTYTAPEGRLDDLLARFRNHTMRIFEKHGMTNVGYWVPQDEPLSENTLVYLLAHDSREAAEASWAAFIADPEWQQVAEESQQDGPILSNVERIWLDPTDFSPMK